MTSRVRKIEMAAETAELLEARAAARGLSVSELLADLAGAVDTLPPMLEAMRERGEGPWSPQVLAEDARRLAAFRETGAAIPWSEIEIWLKSWGSDHELAAPSGS
jgi:hypothetical protein